MPRSTDCALLLAAVALLGACASEPPPRAPETARASPAPSTAGSPAKGQTAPSATAAPAPAATAGAVASGSGAPAAVGAASATTPAAPIPPRAPADFARAVGAMRSGNAVEAELDFKQMTLAYPALSAPYVNLGILYRKAGQLEQSESALHAAVERNGSAIAWNELGATQRLRGEFPAAAASYEHAIAADANYAPAYRNLGVVSDLYLGDPERALSALERYKELTGEDRPVTSWIAELRQRTGKPPLKPPAARGDTGAPADQASPSAAAGSTSSSPQGGAPASAAPQPPH